MNGALLEVDGLTVRYPARRGALPVEALRDVTLSLGPGETLAVVGESGSGKSTLGNTILGLVPATAGRIRLAGTDITRATPRQRRRLTSEVQVVFQNPYASLNPTRRIGQALEEPLLAHTRMSRAARRAEVAGALRRVGLDAGAAEGYPGRFSGGQLQRVAIARALLLSPRLVICDEPVSSLDLSIQAQILNLLSRLQGELGLSYLFVSHDLAVVRHMAHRVAVLYRGRLLETGTAADVDERPAHPYTRALHAASPVPDPAVQRGRRATAAVEPVDLEPLDDGCPYRRRCPLATPVCATAPPVHRTGDHAVACHHPVPPPDRAPAAAATGPTGKDESR